MKIKLNFDKEKLLNFFRQLPTLAKKSSKFFVFFIALAVFSYAGLVWHRYIYKPELKSFEKSEYIKNKEKDINLDENKYKKIICVIESRKKQYLTEIKEVKDIFRMD